VIVSLGGWPPNTPSRARDLGSPYRARVPLQPQPQLLVGALWRLASASGRWVVGRGQSDAERMWEWEWEWDVGGRAEMGVEMGVDASRLFEICEVGRAW